MILSVSRRTDIPAFYSDWFYTRLKEGFVVTRNPFNANQLTKLHLDADHVDAIVFWTKNARPMLSRLDELDNARIPYYFQFTITPYGQDLEPNLPKDKSVVIEAFKSLAQRIGQDRVIWRYDPILFSSKYTTDFHKRAFSRCADLLAGSTNKVIISFLDMDYNNTKRIQKLGIGDGSQGEKNALAAFFAESARQHGMTIETCAEDIDLEEYGITRGHCIDSNLIEHITGKTLTKKGSGKDKNQRLACGCIGSTDIGIYNTCAHGCAYCYANFSPKAILGNREKHDPSSPVLLGRCDAEALDFKKVNSVFAKESLQEKLLFSSSEAAIPKQ